MTDSSDPTSRRSRRRDPSREPPTIDLKATVIEEGASAPPGGAAADEPLAAGTPSGDTVASDGTADRLAGTSDPSGLDQPSGTAPDDASTPAPGVAEPASADVTADAPVSDADMNATSPGETSEAQAAPGADAPPPSDPVVPPPSAAPGRSAGFGSLAAAGLLGGVVGAGLVLAYDMWGSGEQQSDPRIAQLEQRLSSIPRPDANALQRLEARIGALEGSQGTANQRLQAAQAAAERAMARADEAANRPLPSPAAPTPAPQTTAALTELGNRIGALEGQMRERAQAASAAAQASTNAVQGLERRMGEQDQRLDTLARQVAEGGSEATRAGTRVVLADRLNNALHDGAPYADLLGALARFNVDPARLQPLEPFASGGAPTAAALAQSFRPLAEQIQRDSRTGAESWTDRLARMAEQVVTIRSMDQPAATGVPGLVGRIEAALARGAFADAAAAWDALSEPARRPSEDWGRQLKQRAAAEAAARALAADAVAALNPTTR